MVAIPSVVCDFASPSFVKFLNNATSISPLFADALVAAFTSMHGKSLSWLASNIPGFECLGRSSKGNFFVYRIFLNFNGTSYRVRFFLDSESSELVPADFQ